MSKLKIVDYKTMHALLTKLGFEIARQKGSHIRYQHPDGRSCTVPRHGNRDLSRPLLRAILRDIDLTPEQYHEELENL
jgi:predicted RNA binding protein YcfA (HicA-like mRNA interferase family)